MTKFTLGYYLIKLLFKGLLSVEPEPYRADGDDDGYNKYEYASE